MLETVNTRRELAQVADDARVNSLNLYTPADLKRLPPPVWLVEDYLQASTIGLFFGPSNTFKTFVALDIALSVASGRDWHGAAVQRGAVIYISGEGRVGMRDRVAAWENVHGVIATDEIQFLFEPVQFHREPSVREFLDGLESSLRQKTLATSPSLVVVDTLARCFVGGDENEARDMGEFVAGVENVRRRLDCTILILHHTGHANKSRARGSSALHAAMDTVWNTSKVQRKRRGKSYQVELSCAKHKDADEFAPRDFVLDEVPLDGGRTSLALLSDRETLTNLDRFILNTINKHAVPHDIVGGPTARGMTMTELRETMANPNGGFKKTSEKKARSRLDWLDKNGYITKQKKPGRGGKYIYCRTNKPW